MSTSTVITYSQLSTFLSCRRKMKWRYLDELVPLDQPHSLRFGSLIHDCLERWHGGDSLESVLGFIDRQLPDHRQDPKRHADWQLAIAMMRGYAKAYPSEDFEVVALEKAFEGPIKHPETEEIFKSFAFAGKVDGIVKRADGYYLLEHKTAAQIDAGYLEKLWTDFQIIVYAVYAKIVWGIDIKGVVYNVLTKAKLKQKTGETEAQFEVRRAELIAKSKTGKSSAKRKMPESDADFQDRLAAKYEEPCMFHREVIYLSRDQRRLVSQELWDLAQALLDAKRTGVYLPNRAACFQYGRACAYLPLCRSPEKPDLVDNLYERRPPHTELTTEPAKPPEPVF